MPRGKPKGKTKGGSATKSNSTRKRSQSPTKPMGAQSMSDINAVSKNAREERAKKYGNLKD